MMDSKNTDQTKETKEQPATNSDVDIIRKSIGAIGRYQYWICFLVFITSVPIAFHQMAILFLAPPVQYTCSDTQQQTCPCSDPQYDRSIFTNSIIMEWDLICERTWLRDFTQTLFQLGTLLGSLLFGMASDRFGRKNPLIASVILQIVTGIVAAYMENYWAFTILRFLVGFSVGGMMVVGFVIIMEIVGSQYRDVVSATYQIPFNLGHLLLPLFGYYFRDYFSFQMAVSLPTIVLLAYFVLLPESPRWLLAVKKTDRAIYILEDAAKMNKRSHDSINADVHAYQAEGEKSDLRMGTALDLFRTPNLRRNMICVSFNWLVCSYCFYGVSQYVSQLSGNIFVNVLASGCLALVGSVVSIPLLGRMGRKTLIIGAQLMCAVCLLLIAVVPEGTASVVLGCLGVMSSFIVILVVYLFCSELFPTVVRNSALGIASMTARVGSMAAPFVVGLQDISPLYPPIAFGVMPIIAAVFCYLLPETKGYELTTTLEEGENFGKKTESVESA